MTIRTPPGWGADLVAHAYQSMTTLAPDHAAPRPGMVEVRKIDISDLRWALARGWDDFAAARSDLVFLCVVYPLVGLILARAASGYGMLPLVFPLASGFALIGPLAAVGLNEMSRRLELGHGISVWDAFAVFRSPAIGGILLLGAIMLGLLLFWLVLSNVLYNVTLGPEPPASISAFVSDLLHTSPGHALIVVGVGVGFLLAVVALSIGCVSFPMLLDRNVSLETAVRTSILVVWRNPLTMAAWGGIVVAGLVIGSIPLLLGLVIVMPVLGHGTWHLYRRAVA
jgi:uncharacterized membrane protein